MKETQDIIRAYENAVVTGQRMALATVVQVEGSSYRRPGARMLVTEDGRLTGAISGGCLEGDALRKALLAIAEDRNKLVIYDTTEDDDAKIGIQLGCNGIVHILFEPVHVEHANNPVVLLQHALETRSNTVLATLFNLVDHSAEHPGTCLFVSEKVQVMTKGDMMKDISAALWKDAIAVLHQGTSKICAFGKYTALLAFTPPPISLLIVGAGNDAIPVMRLATSLGWQITIADGRDGHATARRFPDADRILVLPATELMKHLMFDKYTAIVLMTHNYNYDLAVFRDLLQMNCKYIGVLGPKSKLDRMLSELQQSGMEISAEQKDRLFGPVGLDIGAETAEEIAVSIIAEIQAVFSGRNGGVLRQKQQPIHGRKFLSHE